MALNLTTPRAYPIFLTKNYFNGDAYKYGGTFSTTSMGGIGPRLFDMDPYAYGLSNGSAEGVAETIISQLYEGYALSIRAIGLLALLNTNLKTFVVYGSADGGATWPTTIANVAANAATDYVLDLSAAPILINAIKIVATNTIGAVAEKQIGTVVLCGVLLQVTRAPDKIVRKFYDSRRVVVLADKSEDVTHIKRSPASQGFNGRDLHFTYLPDADRDALLAIRRATPSFCLMAEPGERPRELFYGRFDGNWSDESTLLYKGQGNTTVVSFKETTS